MDQGIMRGWKKYRAAKRSEFPTPVPPYPGWTRRICRIHRPISSDDIRAFVGNEEHYTRDTPCGIVSIIHKYGLVEIHCIPGKSEIEVWFNPERESYSSEYLDALLTTRF